MLQLLLLGMLCRSSSLSGAFAAAVLSAAVGMERLLVSLVMAMRGARVVRAFGGALIDLMTGCSRWHLIGMWRMHWLIPALHRLLQRQWRRRLHGRGQCITAVASSVVAATTRRLIFAHCVPLCGIVDMYVAGGHVTAGAGSRKIGRQWRRMLAGGRDLIAILCAASSAQRIAIKIFLWTASGALWRNTPSGKAT